MQDFLFVSFFLGHDAGAEARRLLRECDLLEHALADRANRHAWRAHVHTGVYVRLPAHDPRIHKLLKVLAEQGCAPFTRYDREYSAKELDAADWLVMRIATAGLWGGVDLGQAYDFTPACPICGAGATLEPPLIAELGRMGKKDLDHTVYEGHLVASTRVAKGLESLTGVELCSVRSPRRPPDSRFYWLSITSHLPRMHPAASGYMVDHSCVSCGRAGHFGRPQEPESPANADLSNAADFNLTWEYFGDWRQIRHPSHTRPVGGKRELVVSQRARQRLKALKVRRLVWQPVHLVAPNSIKPE